MSEHENGSLIERVERLERDVEELQSKLRQAPRSAAVVASPFPETATVSRAEQATSGPGSRSFGAAFNLGNLSRGEWWLNKLGIGLLLFRVAFLFMFSVERGWITPPCASGSGLRLAPRCSL